jgi:hypothetical protein
MMIQKLLVVFSLFCLTTSLFAQDKITLQEERLSSFYPQSIFKGRAKGYIFKVGESDFQPVGRKGESIEAILMQDEAAYKEFKKFKRKMNSGSIAYGVGAAAYLSTPFLMDANDSIETMQIKNVAAVGTLLVGTVTGLILHYRCTRNLKKAVEIYNLNLE